MSEMVRSTLTPDSEAISRSCSQARCARPSAVRAMISQNTVIRTSVVTTMRIWILERLTAKPFWSNRT
ncbi:MAG: hypothetical protein A2W02_03505 [Alphaproteobacteria bacterium RBG_16_64_48]|nr:MAG: hypothetical protein A2W02_03505 [Alphaproteobacteria bacterium RBG_16_64_48]